MIPIEKLKLQDLKVGMHIKFNQLTDILDTWILVEEKAVGADGGIIRFIGKEPNSISQAILEEGKPIGCIYNDSEQLEEDVYFDE